MSRVAEGVLRVTVQDEQLDNHVQRLQSVKAAWKDLEAGSKALQNLVPASLTTDMQNLNKAFAGVDSSKISGIGQSLMEVNKAVTGLGKKIAPLAEAFRKLGSASAAAQPSLAAAQKVITETGSALNKHLKPTQLNDIAKAMRGVGNGAARTGKGYHEAANGVRDYVRAAKEAVMAGVAVAKQIDDNTNKLDKQGSSLKRLQQDFVRMGAVLFIAYHWVKGFLELLDQGAQKIDLENTLTLSLKNFEQTMKDTKAATAGTVSELEMMKSAALMSSFGLPMENFADQMGMVQKMAIRTGQSTEYLMESLARGVSRLSPMILDNLGLQISLSKSYEK
jgi:hypothetical protein